MTDDRGNRMKRTLEDIRDLPGELRAPCDWCHPCYTCRDLMRDAADEIDRLQAIVDRLPKTEDRVPIYPGLEAFTTYDSGPILVEAFHRCYSNRAWLIDTDRGPRMASECWSTREAAEKARAT